MKALPPEERKYLADMEKQQEGAQQRVHPVAAWYREGFPLLLATSGTDRSLGSPCVLREQEHGWHDEACDSAIQVEVRVRQVGHGV